MQSITYQLILQQITMANQYAGISTHIASRNAAINNNNGGNSGGVSMAASIGEIQPEHQKALDTTKQF